MVDAGLVICRGTPPDATYIFKHALVQDVAYESLLRSTRADLHASIARVLENDFADLVENKPEVLARHHTLAGNVVTAIPLWRKAGTLAVRRVALQDAVAHFQKGLGLVEQLPASPERDALELTIREPLNAAWTGLHGWAAFEVSANAGAILQLAKGQRNAQSLLLGLWWMWTSTITQGRIADSLQWAERLLAEGNDTGDINLQIFGHAATMVQYFLNGRMAEAREHADRALAMYDPQRAQRWIQLTGHDLKTFVEVYACQLIWMQGYPEQAVRMSERSSAHAREVGHAFNLVWAVTFGAYVFDYRRDPQGFLERIREADRLAREQGIAFISQVSVPQATGLALLHGGSPADAIALLRQGIESWTKVGGNVRDPLPEVRAGRGGRPARRFPRRAASRRRVSGADRAARMAGARVAGRSLANQGIDPDAPGSGRGGRGAIPRIHRMRASTAGEVLGIAQFHCAGRTPGKAPAARRSARVACADLWLVHRRL